MFRSHVGYLAASSLFRWVAGAKTTLPKDDEGIFHAALRCLKIECTFRVGLRCKNQNVISCRSEFELPSASSGPVCVCLMDASEK